MTQIQFGEVKTQTDAILWHLQTYGKITSWEAIKEYGATRLSAIIFNLRGRGYDIVSVDKEVENRFKRKVTIAVYQYQKAIPKNVNSEGQHTIFD